jgi:hypothetical protein
MSDASRKEATMTEPKPQKKRVVSKSEYAAHLARKTTFKTGSTMMSVGGGIIVTLALVGYWVTLPILRDQPSWLTILFLLAWPLICIAGVMWCIREGAALNKQAEEVEPLLPPTRHNIEQLPAEETLVRASTEPIHEQEKVLLRAATGAEETPPEQLLRPTISN